MICILALIVFGILGVFSAKYRVIAKEAFGCVFKKITLRKCDTGLDTRLKSQITGSFMRFSPKTGRAIYKYFEVFSWILLIITLASLFFVGQGIYYYAKYGNCNGPQSDQFCIFDPLGTNKPAVNPDESTVCAIPGHNPAENKTLTPPPLRDSPYLGNPNATVVIIEYGCYECYYTKKAETTVKKIVENYGDEVLYIYKDYPFSPSHINAIRASEASYCALEQNKYWEYRDYLFANQPKLDTEHLVKYATELNLDMPAFESCLSSEKYKDVVEQNYEDGIDSGIKVTPTFFINNRTIVGAEDYSQFRKAIRQELRISWWQFWK